MKGFGEKKIKPIFVDAASIELPSGPITAYRNRRTKTIYLDAEEILGRYGLTAIIPSVNELKIHVVRPKGGHPEIGDRAAYKAEELFHLGLVAKTHGTIKGKLAADKDFRAFCEIGMRQEGISGIAVEDDRLVPVNDKGERIEKYAIKDLDAASLQSWDVVLSNPVVEKLHNETGTIFFAELATIAVDRVYSFRSKQEIADYVMGLVSGLLNKNPNLGDEFCAAFAYLILGDRTLEIAKSMDDQREADPDVVAAIYADVFRASGREALISEQNGKEEMFFNAEDCRHAHPFFQGKMSLLDLAEAIEQAQHKK